MKKDFMNKLSRFAHNVGFNLQKHSPEILLYTGIGLGIAAGVKACQATLKVDEILDDTKEKIEKIHTVAEDETKAEVYTEKDCQEDLAKVYIQAGWEFAKLYGPAIVLGGLGIGCILSSNKIMKGRNVALAAAYATVSSDFKGYRSRVVERFGGAIDRELKHNIKAEEIEITETDSETGEEVTTKTTIYTAGPNDASGYARFFEKYSRDCEGNVTINPNWCESNEYNLLFLKSQERYANDLLRSRGRVFLNEVYRMLGIPESREGQIVGWRYDEKCPMGDNYISFGIFDSQDNFSDFIYGNDNGILLDFNVDGNIWETM